MILEILAVVFMVICIIIVATTPKDEFNNY